MSDVLRYCYDACGLSVVSDAPIAGLRRAADVGTPDVTVTVEGSATGACRHEDYPRLCYVSPETDASGRPEIRLDAGEDGYRLTFGGAAINLRGRVRNIFQARDVEGVYGAGAAGAAVIRGPQAVVLTNQRGAVMELAGMQTGLMVNLDLNGMAVSLR